MPKPPLKNAKPSPRRRRSIVSDNSNLLAVPEVPVFQEPQQIPQTETTNQNTQKPVMNTVRNTIIAAVIFLGAIISIPKMIESNNASEVLVITKPSGEIVVHSEPGWHWQGFGDPVHYQRRGTFDFIKSDKEDNTIEIRFNDSGTARISGVLNYELSANAEQIKELHSQYLTPEAVENQLIRSFLQMSVFNTGSLLSSTESYSSARGMMFEYIQKQLTDGIFATDGTLTREKDTLGFERTITKIQIRKSKDGQTEIATKSPFAKFGIVVQSLNINGIDYDDKVDAQIQAQLDAVIKVQTAIAEAKRAEQDKITAEQKGLADKAVAEATANVELAKATIEAEKLKTVALTEATQKKEVAELALETAKLDAQAVVEKGKADAEARKLVMEADGALEKKLEAYAKVQESWANAYSQAKFAPVPQVMMGGNGNAPTNAANQMMELISTKAAMDLSLELKPKQ